MKTTISLSERWCFTGFLSLMIMTVTWVNAEQTAEIASPPQDLIPYVMPEQLPEFQQPIADPEYEARKKILLKELDRESLLKSSTQLFSSPVASVFKGTPAAKAGIRKGDYLLSVNGQEFNSAIDPYRLLELNDNGARALSWETASGVQKSANINSPEVNVRVSITEMIWRAPAMYLRSAEMNSKWDDDVLIACLTMAREPLMAETGLARAKLHGYNGVIGLVIAAETRKNCFAYDDALTFGFAALRQLPVEQHDIALRPMITAALMSGRAATALQLAKKCSLPAKRKFTIDEINQHAASMAKKYPLTITPYSYAEQAPYLDLTSDIGTFRTHRHLEEKMRKKKPFKLGAGTDYYEQVPFSPRVKRGQFRARIQMAEKDRKDHGAYLTSLFFGFVGWDKQQQNRTLITLTFDATGLIFINRGSDDQLRIGSIGPQFFDKPFQFSATLNDGFVEFQIEGKRVYIGAFTAIDDEMDYDHFSFVASNTSWTVTISELSWRSIGTWEQGMTDKIIIPRLPQDLIEIARQSENKIPPEETIAAYERAVTVNDWNAKKAFADYYERTKQFDLANQWHEKWAQESQDPWAWLHWAVRRIKHQPSELESVFQTIRAQVPRVESWQDQYDNMSEFFRMLRQAKKTDDLRYYFGEMMSGKPNANAYVQFFYSLISEGQWTKARAIVKKAFSLNILNDKAIARLWLLDATLAVGLGQPPPNPESIYRLANKQKISESSAISFAYFVGDIDEATALSMSQASKDGHELIFYRGCKALAQGKHEEAQKFFKEIIDKYPDLDQTAEAECFMLWFSDQTKEDLTAIRGTQEWPYRGSPLYQGNSKTIEKPFGADDF
jgi:tetratricopeptide (TPR) repeat protein